MKILRCLFLIIMTLSIVGCSDDEIMQNTDVSDNVDMELLDGTWLLTSAVDPLGNDKKENGDCDVKLTITKTSAIFRYYDGIDCTLSKTVINSFTKSSNIISIDLEGSADLQFEVIQLTEDFLRYKLTSSGSGGNYDVYVYTRSINENYDDGISASIAGTWKISSLTSNGVDKLQDKLDGSNPPETAICYWTEVFTETSKSDITFSGTDCTTQTVDDALTYSVDGIMLSYGSMVLEILELTETTLKLQNTYKELGETIIDIYTYTKPSSSETEDDTTEEETSGDDTTGSDGDIAVGGSNEEG